MTNGQKAELLINQYGFDFSTISKAEIIDLLEAEISKQKSGPDHGSSEYIRLLCGYLYCLGDPSDVPLIEKAKYTITMDIGSMIDREWIDSLNNGGVEDAYVRSRQDIIDGFISYYKEFEADDV